MRQQNGSICLLTVKITTDNNFRQKLQINLITHYLNDLRQIRLYSLADLTAECEMHHILKVQTSHMPTTEVLIKKNSWAVSWHNHGNYC